MTLDAADVKRELAFDAVALELDESDFNQLLQESIESATERVGEWVDVSLEPESATEVISRPEGVDGHLLPLPHRPARSVESIEIDTDRIGGAEVSADDVIVKETHLELPPEHDRHSWPTRRRSVAVEWTHGYEEVPGPLMKAIVRIVRNRLQQVESDGVDSDSVFGDSISYRPPQEVLAEARAEVQEFREPSFHGGAMVI